MTPQANDQLLAEFGVSRQLVLQWTVVSIFGVLVSLVGFLLVYYLATGDAGVTEFGFDAAAGWWNLGLTFLFAVGSMVLVIVLHELCHGAAIRAFGGTARYGLGVVYAVFPYAFATTDTRFTRNQFLVVALAPLVLLTLLGVPAMVLFEWPWLAVPLALNAGGAVGDVWMALTLLSYPAGVSVIDSETGLEVYGPPGLERWETAPATVVWDLVVGTAGGVLALSVAIGIVVPLALAAIGVDSLTVGIPDTLLFVFGFRRPPDGGVEFSMGSGVFLVGGAVGIVYAYVRARRRSG
ncbi:DUF3267 domain-containing protein [Halorubrum sp. CBA1229]|uniref:DUF3267 domain-containing protein n=1 Tax=Halorubrum sp. CBA1229 TaxID=1853699 RepID=UPI000F41C5E8|nr:DUF3267 domain-containing protein [Halorubrum sp. CBA1229]QKY18596.1 DUF3267 domain-containing protein [Halorubrum sp. CBA1229]